nr:PHP domain-containing protein [Gammaproteobacteria bacterium]
MQRILKLINYSNDYIAENLSIKGMILEEATSTLSLNFSSPKPLDCHEINNFYFALSNAKIPGIEKIKFTISFDDYGEEEVFSYYQLVVNNVSKIDLNFVPALNYAKSYDQLTKTLTLNVPSVESSIILSKKQLVKEYKKFGFNDLNIDMEIIDLDDTIKEEIEESRRKIREEIVSQFSANDEYVSLQPNKELVGDRIDIKDLPDGQEEFQLFRTDPNYRNAYIIIGTIEQIDKEAIDKRSSLKMVVKDNTGYIYVQRRIRSEAEKKYFRNLEIGRTVNIQAFPQINMIGDVYMSLVNMSYSKTIRPVTDRTDDEPRKRVELHVHTKMSQLDGVPFIKEYCECATKWGHKAIACTDHGSVQAFHDMYEYCEKHPELKPIYGAEFSFVDEEKVLCAYHPSHIILDDATYVVYDFETTGFSVTYEKVIEVSAVKIKNGVILDRFSELVNPEKIIPSPVVALTGITN